MKNILLLIKKELKGYFISPVAYVVIIIFLLAANIWFVKDLFVNNEASARKLFEILPLLFIFIIPAFTMKSWAEERKDGTIEILRTFPISKWELVLGKFFSTLIYFTILILTLFPIIIVLNILGNPDNGVMIAASIASIFLAASYIAIGQLVSINTTNQIISFILSVVFIGILYIVGDNSFLQFLPSSIRSIVASFGLGEHFRSIIKGVIDSRDILYYMSIIILIIFFIYKSLSRLSIKGK